MVYGIRRSEHYFIIIKRWQIIFNKEDKNKEEEEKEGKKRKKEGKKKEKNKKRMTEKATRRKRIEKEGN